MTHSWNPTCWPAHVLSRKAGYGEVDGVEGNKGLRIALPVKNTEKNKEKRTHEPENKTFTSATRVYQRVVSTSMT